MAKTISGVPESITRDQYLSLITSVGFTPEDLRDLQFTAEGIHATVFERAKDGTLRIDDEGTDIVTSTVFIPVEDGK